VRVHLESERERELFEKLCEQKTYQASLYVYVYIYIYIYMYIYMCKYIYVYVCVCVCAGV